jgi:hypothetical protein
VIEVKMIVRESNPVHVRVAVYAGEAERTLGSCGTLVFRREEWAALRHALGARGTVRHRRTVRGLRLTVEDPLTEAEERPS